MRHENFEIITEGNVNDFEKRLLRNSEQEIRIDKRGVWCQLADIYAIQLALISSNPYPEESESFDKESVNDDENLPSIKHIDKNIAYENFYRWGIQSGRIGNHRIIYAIHNYNKVIMLYHFDKQYNGLIKRSDLIPAELSYKRYCILDPSMY